MIEKTDKKTCNIKCPNIGRCKDGCSLDKVLEEVNKEAPKNTQTIYSEILLAIKQGENIFLTASAGCGKSYLLNSIRKNLPILTVTASTGIAALNIGGSTLHSALHIGLANKPIPILIKTLTKKELLDIQKIHFLAIDEISMISGKLLDYCNKFLKQVRDDKRPFGGVQVILIGDFCQLPPVNKNSLNYDFAFLSGTWKELNLKTFMLKHNFRQQHDKNFAEILEHLRKGKVTAADFEKLQSRELPPPESAPRLFPVNIQVNTYNKEKMESLKEAIYTNKAEFTGVASEIAAFPDIVEQYANIMRKNSIMQDELRLCKGARIMITRNIEKDVVNGSLGYVTEISGNDNEISHLVVKIDNYKEITVIPVKEELYDHKGNKLIEMHQYPCKLAYSASVHKMQGCTLSECFIDFARFFEVNQAYVALSRVKTLNGLYVKNLTRQSIKFSDKVLEFQKTL